jgi:hypothetical protein
MEITNLLDIVLPFTASDNVDVYKPAQECDLKTLFGIVLARKPADYLFTKDGDFLIRNLLYGLYNDNMKDEFKHLSTTFFNTVYTKSGGYLVNNLRNLLPLSVKYDQSLCHKKHGKTVGEYYCKTCANKKTTENTEFSVVNNVTSDTILHCKSCSKVLTHFIVGPEDIFDKHHVGAWNLDDPENSWFVYHLLLQMMYTKDVNVISRVVLKIKDLKRSVNQMVLHT